MQLFQPNWRPRTTLVGRTLLVYVLSVLLTCLLGAALTYVILEKDLESDGRARLLTVARLYGVAVFSRLSHADQVLEQLATASTVSNDSNDSRPPLDAESPLASVRFVQLGEHESAPDEDPARARQLAAAAEEIIRGNPLHDSTLILAREDANTLPVLVRQVPGIDRLMAVGWIRPDYLWSSMGRLPEGMQLCVNGTRVPLHVCRYREGQIGLTDATGSCQDCLTARWPLFLRGRFGIDEWSVETSQPRSELLTPLVRFRTHAVPIAGGAVLLALVLGTVIIRRNFGPLELLLTRWNASSNKVVGSGVKEPADLEHLSRFIALSGVRGERSRRLLEILMELDRKMLVAESLQTTVLWLLPQIAAEVDARGVAALLTATPEEASGTLYLATMRSPASSCACDISIQTIRTLLEFEGVFELAKLEAHLPQVTQSDFRTGRAYPIRDERHLVGALLLLDVHGTDTDMDRQSLAFADRLSVTVSHWRRKADLAHAMRFDSLTGLANRDLLVEHLAQALARSSAGQALAVMLIGFDGLENINATLGHRAGDQLLRLATSRIRAVVRETETLARITGNELVLLVPELDEPASAATAAQRIIALFEKPFLAEGLSYSVSVSIGIAVAPADGITPDGLIRSAETAMRRAKSGSAGRIAFFEEIMNEHARRRIWLEHGLRGVLGTPELQLHFQPKVELTSGCVIGAEALLRWMHPDEGMIPPTEFIPTAEASGLIVPIGQWVLEESCRRLLEWRRAGIHLDHMAVNISLRQLQDNTFLEYLLQYLAAGGIDGHSLELEVTESMLAAQPARLSGTLERIRRSGVRIAIDDFGTGYSSLALLQLLPVDVLKIDRAFVSEIGSGTGDAIVKAIIAMGLALDKDLVAEGVETEAQARALTQRGCRSAQGFFYSPAMAADDFVRFCRERQNLLDGSKPLARQA